jgi:hypothetical protein
MKYAEDFRRLARRCCVLSKTAVDPELVDQMRLWAVDFADEADKVERRTVQRDRYPVARSVRWSSDRSGGPQPARRGDRKRRWHGPGAPRA